jgi:hypothetical protein
MRIASDDDAVDAEIRARATAVVGGCLGWVSGDPRMGRFLGCGLSDPRTMRAFGRETSGKCTKNGPSVTGW